MMDKFYKEMSIMTRKNNTSHEARMALNQFKIEMSSELGLNTTTDNEDNINTVVMNAYRDRISYEDYDNEKNE